MPDWSGWGFFLLMLKITEGQKGLKSFIVVVSSRKISKLIRNLFVDDQLIIIGSSVQKICSFFCLIWSFLQTKQDIWRCHCSVSLFSDIIKWLTWKIMFRPVKTVFISQPLLRNSYKGRVVRFWQTVSQNQLYCVSSIYKEFEPGFQYLSVNLSIVLVLTKMCPASKPVKN